MVYLQILYDVEYYEQHIDLTRVAYQCCPHQLVYLVYIDTCNQIASANMLPLYPCKLPWVRSVLQKPTTLRICLYNNHNNKTKVIVFCFCGSTCKNIAYYCMYIGVVRS